MSLVEYLKHPWATEAESVLSKMKLVQELLDPVPSENSSPHHQNWKLKSKNFPYSCSDEEGLLLYFTIKENHFKSGFEIATAFGYSTCYLGLAFQKTGGTCTTVDCYIEEFKDDCFYTDNDVIREIENIRSHINSENVPIGLSTAKSSAHRLGLEHVIEFKIGLSPNDIPQIIGQRKIDFAFIDGGHFGDQPTKDFLAIAPYLSEKCAILFHDNNYNKSVYDAIITAQKHLNGIVVRTHTKYNLTLVGKNLDSSFIKLFQTFPALKKNHSLENFRFFKFSTKRHLKKLLKPLLS
ncbi:MAG: class I SAM-dependent methyltransferase [Chlorobiales bacterium]